MKGSEIKRRGQATAFSQQNEDPKEFKLALRQISQKMLSLHSKREDFTIQDLNKSEAILAHWMSLILISGPAIKVTFKAHFMTSFAKKLAAPLYGKSLEELQEEQGLDFMREFCNLTAGAIKRVLLNIQQKTGVSIPVVTRGFDELFFPRSSLPNVFHDLWTLKCELGQLHCSVVIELFEKMDLSQVSAELADPDTDQGDVEFL